MSKKIFKYKLEIAEEQIVKLPLGYRILTVQVQRLIPVMYVLLDDEQQNYVDVKILTFGTGYELPDNNYLDYHGTYQLQGGNLVYHVFTSIK